VAYKTHPPSQGVAVNAMTKIIIPKLKAKSCKLFSYKLLS